MHIQEFVREGDGPLGAYGLENPVAEARVVTQGNQEFGLRLGTPIPGTDRLHAVTRARPHVLGVSVKYLPVLEWSADAFRRTAPVTFGLDHVDSLGIRGPNGRRFLKVESEAASNESDILREVLGNWIMLRAERFEPATSAVLRQRGLSAPRWTMTWLGSGDTLAVIDVGRAEGETFPLRVSGGRQARPDEVLLLPEDQTTPLWMYLQRMVEPPGPE
jgi:hypothetical protein